MKNKKSALIVKGVIAISVGILLMFALAKITPGMDTRLVISYYISAALWIAVGVAAPFVHGARTSPR